MSRHVEAEPFHFPLFRRLLMPQPFFASFSRELLITPLSRYHDAFFRRFLYFLPLRRAPCYAVLLRLFR